MGADSAHASTKQTIKIEYLLGYFGEHLAEPCGNCSSCQGNFVERDITVEAQKILSGVARVERMYPYGLQ